jgi:hypothetical protein
MVSAVLIFALMASGLYVPVYHHGGHERGAESDLHRVVHSHGGRVHVHVYHHQHGSDCHGHHSIENDSHGHDHDHEHPDTEHAHEILLGSAKCGPWKQVLNHLRLADDVQGAAVLKGIESCEIRPGSVRPPPGRASPPDHLHIVRSVVLRL